ncbi:hypothetical protein CDD80_5999 [Ophiocordyceps camponoti-rufipedis]|uniref:Swiss Army Knife protein DSP-PTPase phosphatase domain-containing protein n=1 Tax=Ophiocordyceps camponoti-rufipedis TaxID=2004952 RepID=A0A2C5YT02_9HYPO|nr:hypothetical protein CDD80_5999 [Ophiocordyceps camponoti-rufipedis]
MRPSILYALLSLIDVSQSQKSTATSRLVRRYATLKPSLTDTCSPDGHGFSRFTWVTEHLLETDKLARSSAPHYSCGDSSQHLNDESIRFLHEKGIEHVISLNSEADNEAIVNKLVENNIKYTAIPVPDWASLSMGEMMMAISFFISEPERPTLIWCGYGHGRTGTLVTAIQMFRLRQMEKPLQLDEDDYMSNHVETQPQRSLLDVYQFTLNVQSDNDFRMRFLVGDYYLSFATALRRTENLKKTLYTQTAENMKFQTIVNLVRETAWAFQLFQRFSALEHELVPENMQPPVIRRPEKEVVEMSMASDGDDFILQLNALVVEVGIMRAHLVRYKDIIAPCEALRDIHDVAAKFVNSKVKTLLKTAQIMRTNLAHKYFTQLEELGSEHKEMDGVETNVASTPYDLDSYDRAIEKAEQVVRRMTEVETFELDQVTSGLKMDKVLGKADEDSSSDSMESLHSDSEPKFSSVDLNSIKQMHVDSEFGSESEDTFATADTQVTVVPAKKTAAEKASPEEEEGLSAAKKAKVSDELDSNMWTRKAIEEWRQSVALAEPDDPVEDQELPDVEMETIQREQASEADHSQTATQYVEESRVKEHRIAGSSFEYGVAPLDPVTAPIEVSSEETLALMEEVMEEAILEALKQLPPLPRGPIGDATIGGREKVALLSRSISALNESEKTDEMWERGWKVRVLAPVVTRILQQTLLQTLDKFDRQIALLGR